MISQNQRRTATRFYSGQTVHFIQTLEDAQRPADGGIMAVTRKDVDIAAMLARLYFSEDEKVEIEGTLNNILGYFDKLSEIDTKGVEPLAHILPVKNVVRKDEVKPSLDQETALGNAPKHDRGHFVIPKVIE